MERIRGCRAAIFGIGGVGGYAMECLARMGVGTLDLFDSDNVSLSNLNRQIISLHSTVDIPKVEAAKQRIADINPDIIVHTHNIFYLPGMDQDIPFDQFDYIVDAIDTVSAKIDLIIQAHQHHIPIISAMGCGNRIDPSHVKNADIFETSNDPLCRIMRHELRKRGISHLNVVYSDEDVIRPLKQADTEEETGKTRRDTPGSTVFVPAAAGIMIASIVFKDLSRFDRNSRTLFSESRNDNI